MVKKPITEIGEGVPSNLVFALVVAVGIFWADVLRYILIYFFAGIGVETYGMAEAVLLAMLATMVGFSVLSGYRQIRARLRKIKVQT